MSADMFVSMLQLHMFLCVRLTRFYRLYSINFREMPEIGKISNISPFFRLGRRSKICCLVTDSNNGLGTGCFSKGWGD